MSKKQNELLNPCQKYKNITYFMKNIVVVFCLLLTICSSAQIWKKIQKSNGKLGSFLNSYQGKIQNFKYQNQSCLQIYFCGQIENKLRKCITISIQKTLSISNTSQAKNIIANLTIELINKNTSHNYYNHSFSLTGDLIVKKQGYLLIASEGDTFLFYLSEDQAKINKESMQNKQNSIQVVSKTKKRIFTSQYFEQNQIQVIFTFFNLFTAAIYVSSICFYCFRNGKQGYQIYSYNQKQRYQNYFQQQNLSKTADFVLIISTAISYNYIQSQTFKNLQLQLFMLVISFYLRAAAAIWYLMLRIEYYLNNKMYKYAIFNLFVYTMFLTFSNRVFMIILGIFFVDDVKTLLKKNKINTIYRQTVHYQLLLIFILPVLKILIGIPQGEMFDYQIYLWFFLGLWIILALMYEISFRVGFATMLRKIKWNICQRIYDFLPKKLNDKQEWKVMICRICYSKLSEEEAVIIKESCCKHQFHAECIKANNLKKCPVYHSEP